MVPTLHTREVPENAPNAIQVVFFAHRDSEARETRSHPVAVNITYVVEPAEARSGATISRAGARGSSEAASSLKPEAGGNGPEVRLSTSAIGVESVGPRWLAA